MGRSHIGGGLGVGGRVDQVGRPFQVLVLTTLVSIFALVILGGVVRLTESGLGCPDWPLCHGKIIPSADTSTLIEYSHRLLASVVGLLVLGTTLIVWRSYRSQPWLLGAATLGLVLLVAQVLLGGVTVLEELPDMIVLAHLATAEALLACMVVVCFAAYRGRSATSWVEGSRGRELFPVLSLGTVLVAYALLLTGSYVTVSGATVACGQEWPLCQGGVLPDGELAAMHMVHRLVSMVGGILIVAVVTLAWRRRQERPLVGWGAVAVSVAFAGQVLVGAVTIWTGFPMEGRLLHLAVATLVWVGLVSLAVLTFSAAGWGRGGASGAQA